MVNRGSLTFWMDEQAITQWYCHEHHGRPRRGVRYSDSVLMSCRICALRILCSSQRSVDI
ncbi:transposase [Zobellella aerophila]|uniref:transposase n=1 Tax=Zobellella aerophila TaxID=870480 RepID=UPI0031EAD888